jgi:NADPH-dependent 2,4-dienoyl-CoA reductase/sulfur reductase-like enzyme
MSTHRSRREFLRASAAAASATLLPMPAIAQAVPRIVVVGGGFGGATVARTLKAVEPKIQVTLVETSPTFTACPFSNTVIGGLRELKAQQFGYDRIRAAGINVVIGTATGVDASARTVRVGDQTLPYDRLVLSPGIDIRWDALPGYNEAASTKMPHAWRGGEQTTLLRSQLEAMEDGGLVVMSAPANPFRCPPGPYERACMIGHYLKTRKPKSKLLVLDAKDQFSKQGLFTRAWKEIYPNHIEWVSLSSGGKVTSVDPSTNTLNTDFGKHTAKVANVIPPQKAGRIAEIAGVTNQTGWCPINPETFESRQVPNIHVVGDATIAAPMPKSGFVANSQGKVVAYAIAKLLAGEAWWRPTMAFPSSTSIAPPMARRLRYKVPAA